MVNKELYFSRRKNKNYFLLNCMILVIGTLFSFEAIWTNRLDASTMPKAEAFIFFAIGILSFSSLLITTVRFYDRMKESSDYEKK